MTEKEVGELYIRLAFQYESAIGRLLEKKIIDQDSVDRHRKSFYDSLDEEKLRTAQKIGDYTEIIRRYMRGMICEDMVSLTGLAKQYSEDSPGYIIQSWMRSRNTLEFLRQWEDEKHTANATELIFSYPSDKAPEQEVFCNQVVSEFLSAQYNINFSDVLATVTDHHEYADRISQQGDVDAATIEVQCMQTYILHQDVSKFLPLISEIKSQC